jgi:hypothetical protein
MNGMTYYNILVLTGIKNTFTVPQKLPILRSYSEFKSANQ